jgi:hypothetical protein
VHRFLLICALTSGALAGCQVTAAPTQCPSRGELAIETDTKTPGDFAEWEATTLEYATALMGMAESAAEKCALAEGFSWRVVARDGEYFPITADYSPSRINATIMAGVVADVSAG